MYVYVNVKSIHFWIFTPKPNFIHPPNKKSSYNFMKRLEKKFGTEIRNDFLTSHNNFLYIFLSYKKFKKS